MKDLERLKTCLDELGIPFEEKTFKVATSIYLRSADDGVTGDVNAFVDFKFDDTDGLVNTWISGGRPASVVDSKPIDKRRPKTSKTFAAPPKK